MIGNNYDVFFMPSELMTANETNDSMPYYNIEETHGNKE